MLLGATTLVAPATASADPLADADATVTALRRQADEASTAYYAALTQAQTLEFQIAQIGAQLPELKQRRRVLRANAVQRAVNAYRRAGSDLGAFVDSGDALVIARRTKWLGNLNERDNQAFTKLARVSTELDTQRQALQVARVQQQTALDQLQARGRDINAKLQAAEDRKRSLAAKPPRPVVPKGTGDAPPAAPVDYVPQPDAHPQHADPFLICTRLHESDRSDVNHNGLHDGGYAAYNAAGPYMGAYQFLQSTWNSSANHAGRPELIGVPPNTAGQYDQDDMAWSLYQRAGNGPWGGRC